MPVSKVFEAHASGKPKLAVFKFSSCDGCQLQLLNLEDALLDLVGAVEIAYFLEARRRELPPPYDIGLVEGSISTPEEEDRIQHVRRDCKYLIAIGACATSGGIQALRNWANVDEFAALCLPQPRASQHAGDGHADRRPRVRRLRTPRLPGEPASVAGVGLRAVGGPQAEHPHAQPVHRVQAARIAVRAGDRRPALPGADHANRLRRAVSGLRPRLLRLFRPHGATQHGLVGQLVHRTVGLQPPRNETHAPPVQRIPGTLQASE